MLTTAPFCPLSLTVAPTVPHCCSPLLRLARPGAKEVSSSSKRGSGGKTATLDEYGTNLTAAAAEGKLDPVVGRAKEVQVGPAAPVHPS